MEKTNKNLRIIHFNDVYNIEERNIEPVGGAARFITAADMCRKEKLSETILLFSGDAYSPSTMSILYQGQQMVEPLNQIGIDVACMGNHDLDFTLEQSIKLTKQNNFPWILSNVINTQTKRNLAETHEYQILEKNGLKIGLMGLAEEEWLGVISEIDHSLMQYEDFILCAKRLCKFLKEDKQCDLIVALTHMRNPNDFKLAQAVPEIDLILGGHDHVKKINILNNEQVLFIKSGTDFQLFSYTDLQELDEKNNNEKSDIANNVFIIKNKWKLTTKFVEVTAKFAPQEAIQQHTEYYLNKTSQDSQQILGYTQTDLETRFCKIRSEETNFSNFYADIFRVLHDSDVAILNNGSIRSDCLYPAGYITNDNVQKMFPFSDVIIALELTGKQLHDALENGVCMYPSYDGRYLSVSGITFTFDANKEPNSRINKEDILIRGEAIQYEKKYNCALKYFISLGKDGYDVLKQGKYIVEYQNGTPLTKCIIDFFNCHKYLDSDNQINQARKEKYDQFLEMGLIKKVRYCKEIDQDVIEISPQTEERIKILNAVINNE